MLPTAHRGYVLVLLSLGCIGQSGFAEPLPQADLQVRIAPLVQPYIENNVVMGMTVGILRDGRMTVLGFGRLSATDDQVPDGSTVYEIGSLSKVFTGILLARDVVDGHVTLRDPVQGLLPADVALQEEGRPITLLDLSTHVSGLPRLPNNLHPTNPDQPYANYTAKDLYAFLRSHQPQRAPGVEIEYSNLAVGLLGHLISRRAGVSYETLLKRRVADPLELQSTKVGLDGTLRERLAPAHDADGKSVANYDSMTLQGNGAICSTANDLLKFASAALNPPESDIGEAIELAWRVHQKPIKRGDSAYGLGWFVAPDRLTRWHNGQTSGYHSVLIVNRQQRAAVVILANTATKEVDRLAPDIVKLLSGGNVKPRVFRRQAMAAVSVETMNRYRGKYKHSPGMVFTVREKAGKLMVQLTGQPRYQVYPRSETEWFYKVAEASLVFVIDDDGYCNQLQLLQGGHRLTAVRID